VLEETAIDEVWGIGRAYSKLLRDAGLCSSMFEIHY
jgi:hypothetical protein